MPIKRQSALKYWRYRQVGRVVGLEGRGVGLPLSPSLFGGGGSEGPPHSAEHWVLTPLSFIYCP